MTDRSSFWCLFVEARFGFGRLHGPQARSRAEDQSGIRSNRSM